MNVLVCDSYSAASLQRLENSEHKFSVTLSRDRTPSPEELNSTEALLIRSRTPVDKKLIARASELKLVVTSTSGFDHIDLDSCKGSDIRVSYAPEANAKSAAELTMTLMLNALREIPLASKTLLDKSWKDQLSPGQNLDNLCLGIIGLGRVGKHVARFAQTFGARVFAHDPYVDNETMESLNVSPLGLTELLRQSDIISLHTPLTEETYEMINARTLEFVSDEALLINTSRGAVIHEPSLIDSLSQKRLRGAALDVFVKEPLSTDSALRGLKNVYMTPHIGAKTLQALESSSLEAVEELIRFSQQQQLKNPLA